jgi:hypothetical protein
LLLGLGVHIQIYETRPCSQKPKNPVFEDDWKAACAADPAQSWKDIVSGEAYRCFAGKLRFGEAATCSATTLVPFDPAKQSWDFFFSKVTGHPEDPLGLFD